MSITIFVWTYSSYSKRKNDFKLNIFKDIKITWKWAINTIFNLTLVFTVTLRCISIYIWNQQKFLHMNLYREIVNSCFIIYFLSKAQLEMRFLKTVALGTLKSISIYKQPMLKKKKVLDRGVIFWGENIQLFIYIEKILLSKKL